MYVFYKFSLHYLHGSPLYFALIYVCNVLWFPILHLSGPIKLRWDVSNGTTQGWFCQVKRKNNSNITLYLNIINWAFHISKMEFKISFNPTYKHKKKSCNKIPKRRTINVLIHGSIIMASKSKTCIYFS